MTIQKEANAAARPQKTGGTAGVHPAVRDTHRGLTPGAGAGGTAGTDRASMDSKKAGTVAACAGYGK